MLAARQETPALPRPCLPPLQLSQRMLTWDTLVLCGSAIIMSSSGTLLSLSVMAGRHVCLSLRWNLLIFPREVSLVRYMICDQSLPLLAIASCQRPMKGSFPSLLSFLLSLCPQGRVRMQFPTTDYAIGFPTLGHIAGRDSWST